MGRGHPGKNRKGGKEIMRQRVEKAREEGQRRGEEVEKKQGEREKEKRE